MLKTIEKLDKFYLLYTSVMLVMAIIAIYTFKTLFQSLIDLNVVDDNENTQESRVNQVMIDEAYNFIYNKTPVKLNIK